MQGTVQHARHADVVDVPAVAHGQLGRLVLGAAGADTAWQAGVDHRALGDSLVGVEYLHVAGAAAQVCAEVTGHVVALQVGTLLVDLRFRPHHDARDTEPALQTTTGCERIGEASALSGVDAFQRGDAAASDLVDRVGA